MPVVVLNMYFFYHRKPATTKFRNFNDEIKQDCARAIDDFSDEFYSMYTKKANFKNKQRYESSGMESTDT